MKYTSPTTDDLARIKAELNYTGKQMAELFGLAGDQQWRKYTGGQQPRDMSAQMLFFAAARLELPPDQVERIMDRMRAMGATIELNGHDGQPSPRKT